MQLLTTVKGGGERDVPVYYDVIGGREIVEFTADADIDADGANGQHGGKAAYKMDDTGSEFLANGGMKRKEGGGVMFSHTWGKDIVITNDNGEPYVAPNGVIYSKTAYAFKDKMEFEPDKYLDSETVNYMCVPGQLRRMVKGVVLGCFGQARHMLTGITIPCLVGDFGPRNKAGEVSISLARSLGLDPSPRSGGTERQVIRYTFYPNQTFTQNGFTFPLIPA